MALWAFHNNPGIGGFGESNPILFGGTKINTNKKRNTTREKKKRSSEPSHSTSCKDRGGNRITDSSHSGSNDKNAVGTTSNEYSIGQGDLICQIVKELVDNAVDACRSPISESDNTQNQNRRRRLSKRIRVDIRPFIEKEGFDDESTGSCRDGALQLTVTDTGCGMENIQSCVNAFQSSKGRNRLSRNSDDETVDGILSGRYGIGLTLCLLHAQRSVPNSRACISSATPKSEHLTRAFFEVDKQEDLVTCVQEEVVNFSTTLAESGTCVSLLIPGGKAAKLAWPRLKDYFTRFGLCTNLHFELDVLAPTLSKLPISIRPRKSDINNLRDTPCMKQNEYSLKLFRGSLESDQWEDLLDSDGSEEEEKFKETGTLVNEKKWRDCSDERDRRNFSNAMQSFWPNCNVAYNNVARSVRIVKNVSDEKESTGKEKQEDSVVQLEVSMAICPGLENDKKSDSTVDSNFTASCNALSGDVKGASLQLVRIVNDVPIIENAEAHSCGLVHGVANKRTWGSFGLDIERSVTISAETSLSTPSFVLRDSSLVAPFINKNAKHKQLDAVDCETDHDRNTELKGKRRRRGALTSNDLCPANVRIGTILVVVHVRANSSSLPLPTLSKGRLPLNHQPIDEALQLGLRDCIVSLQSTSQGLFLTTSQLRMAERDVRYVPAMVSAASRIICRSRKRLLRTKCLEFFPKESTGSGDMIQESASVGPVEEEQKTTNLQVPKLAKALEIRLRLAIKVRDGIMDRKRCKREKYSVSNAVDDEFQDFDSDKVEEETFKVSISDKSESLSPSEANLESTSTLSFNSQSSKGLDACQGQFGDYSCETPVLPMKEINIANRPTQSTSEDEDTFDDWL